jgi:hypothetical protein
MGRLAFGILAGLALLTVIAIGFGVPFIAIYFTVFYGINVFVSILISVFAVIVAGVLGFFIIVFVFEERGSALLSDMDESERERLNILRAETRALLEEFDEMVGVLEDIRNLLKEVEG